MELRTKIVSGVIRTLKLPPRFRLKMVKEDPVRLELSLTPSYGKNPVIVGIVESLDLVARRDREGRMPRDLQGTWGLDCKTWQCKYWRLEPNAQRSTSNYV